MRIINTEFTKISDIKRVINEEESSNITLIPNIELEDILSNNQKRALLDHLIDLTTNISERKNMNICILVEYGNIRLTRAKEEKVRRILEQLLHQLEYTKVCMILDTSKYKSRSLTDSIRSGHLLIKEYKGAVNA